MNCCSIRSGRLGLKKFKLVLMLLAMAGLCACITVVHSVTITGVFKDDGVTPVDPENASGSIQLGYFITFDYNPSLCPDPTHEQGGTIIIVGPGTGGAEANAGVSWNTRLYTDGLYHARLEVRPQGKSSFTPKTSSSILIRVKNNGVGEPAPPRRDNNTRQPALKNEVVFGDDINPQTGEFIYSETDLQIPCRGMPLALSRTFRSHLDYNGPLGHGWTHSYDQRLFVQTNQDVLFLDGTGYMVTFTYLASTQSYQGPAGLYATLHKEPDDTYSLRERQGMKRSFNAQGRLTALSDRNQNTLVFSYNAEGLLNTIRDTIGRITTLTYSSGGRLETVTDHSGRVVRYVVDGVGDLSTVTLPGSPEFSSGRTTTFTYSSANANSTLNHNLLTITDPKGQVFLSNAYDAQDRVTTQQFISGTFTLDYQVPLQKTLVTDREGNQQEYLFDTDGHALKRTVLTRGLQPGAPASYVTSMAYNLHGEMTSTVLPGGNSVTYRFDDTQAGRLDQGNLLEMRQKGGSSELVTTFTYEPRFQLVKTITDPRGNDPSAGPPSRYQTQLFYDYEEGPDGLGTDLNGDGVTTQTHGNLVKVVQPTTTVPDATGAAVRTLPRTTLFTFNDKGDLVRQRLASGTEQTFAYFPATATPGDPTSREGYLQSIVRDPSGIAATTIFERDTRGNATAVTDPVQNTTSMEYSPSDRVVRTTSAAPFSYQKFWAYDANDDVVAVRVQNIVATAFGVNTPDASLPMLETLIERNAARMVTAFTQAVTSSRSVRTTREYDRNDRLVREVSPLGHATTIDYEERGLPVRKARGVGSPAPSSVSMAYTANGRVARVTNPLGHATSLIYDGFDRLITTEDPEGAKIERVLDAIGLPLRVVAFDTTARGGGLLREIIAEYDEAGRLVRQRDPVSTGGEAVQTWQRDEMGRVVGLINANGHTQTVAWDALDRATSVVDAVGDARQMEYDAADRLVRATSTERNAATGSTETFRSMFAYDSLNRLTTTINNVGHARSFAHDSRNNVVLNSDANVGSGAQGNTVRSSFDGLGRQTRVGQDLREGGVGSGAVTDEIVTATTWDDDGRMVSVEDDNHAITQYAHDALGRQVLLTYPNGTTQRADFDAAGNAVTVTQPNGTVVTSQFSPMNRMVGRQISRATDVLGETTEQFSYDGLGRPVSLVSDVASLGLTYDSLSRVLTEAQGGKTIASAFDLVGNRTQLTLPGGRTLQMAYDPLERLAQVKDGDDADPLATFQYAGQGRLASRRYQNGVSLGIQYDAVPRAETLTYTSEKGGHGHGAPSSKFEGGFQYVFDNEDNQLAQVDLKRNEHAAPGYDLGRGDVYRYDSAQRLTEATYSVKSPLVSTLNPGTSVFTSRTAYSLDGLGNWLSTTLTRNGDRDRDCDDRRSSDSRIETTLYQNNALNQVVAVNASLLTYDLNGSRKSDSRWSYSYNYRGQMMRASRAIDRDKTLTVSYKYDLLSRRTERQLQVTRNRAPSKPKSGKDKDKGDKKGDDPDPAPQITRYFYQGDRLIEEQNENGVTLATYVHGLGIANCLSFDRINEPGNCAANDDEEDDRDDRGHHYEKGSKRKARRYFLSGSLTGSTTEVTTRRGKVVERYRYDAYGIPYRDDGDGNGGDHSHAKREAFSTAIGTPFLFGGQLYDELLGVYALRFRDYDPALGKFLQRDPLEMADGPNLYLYVGANPVNWIDPLGLGRTKPTTKSDGIDIPATSEATTSVTGQPEGEPASMMTPILIGVSLLTAPGAPAAIAGPAVAKTLLALGVAQSTEAIATAAGDPTPENVSRAAWIAAATGTAAYGIAGSPSGQGRSVPLRFSQTSASPWFDKKGTFSGSTISDVASRLRAGSLAAAEVPVEVVTMDATRLIVNTRSSLALKQAGIPEVSWSIRDMSANPGAVARMEARLRHNQLGTTGTDVLRISGSGSGASTLIGSGTIQAPR